MFTQRINQVLGSDFKGYRFKADIGKNIYVGGPYGNNIVYLGEVGDKYFIYDLDAGNFWLDDDKDTWEKGREVESHDFDQAINRMESWLMGHGVDQKDANAAYDHINEISHDVHRMYDFDPEEEKKRHDKYHAELARNREVGKKEFEAFVKKLGLKRQLSPTEKKENKLFLDNITDAEAFKVLEGMGYKKDKPEDYYIKVDVNRIRSKKIGDTFVMFSLAPKNYKRRAISVRTE